MSLNDFVRQALGGLPSFVRVTAMLGGGALRSYFDGTPVKDYDLFFRSDLDYQLAVREMEQSRRYGRFPDAGRTAVFEEIATGRLYNLIGFGFQEPRETMERFDFRCCRMVAYIDTHGCVVTIEDRYAVADAQSKTLVVLVNNGLERTKRRISHYEQNYGYTLFAPLLPPHLCDAPLDEFLRSLPTSCGGY